MIQRRTRTDPNDSQLNNCTAPVFGCPHLARQQPCIGTHPPLGEQQQGRHLTRRPAEVRHYVQPGSPDSVPRPHAQGLPLPERFPSAGWTGNAARRTAAGCGPSPVDQPPQCTRLSTIAPSEFDGCPEIINFRYSCIGEQSTAGIP